MKRKKRLRSCSAYRGFQVQWNCLEGGVEPHGAAALLVPTAGAGEESEPADFMVAFTHAAPWSAIFVVASSVTIFTTASSTTFATAASSAAIFATKASSIAFAAAASSIILTSVAFSTVVDAAAKASRDVEVDPLPSDPPGAIDAIAVVALRSGRSATATLGACCPNSGGPLTVDPPLWNDLIFLYRGTSSSSDDTSVPLSTI
jgi:hypothetical protein